MATDPDDLDGEERDARLEELRERFDVIDRSYWTKNNRHLGKITLEDSKTGLTRTYRMSASRGKGEYGYHDRGEGYNCMREDELFTEFEHIHRGSWVTVECVVISTSTHGSDKIQQRGEVACRTDNEKPYKIDFTVWSNAGVDSLQTGEEYRITNAKVDEYDDDLFLSITGNTNIQPLDEVDHDALNEYDEHARLYIKHFGPVHPKDD